MDISINKKILELHLSTAKVQKLPKEADLSTYTSCKTETVQKEHVQFYDSSLNHWLNINVATSDGDKLKS